LGLFAWRTQKAQRSSYQQLLTPEGKVYRGQILFSVVSSTGKEATDKKEHKKFCHRKHFCAVQVTKHWHRLLERLCALEVFKSCLYVGNLLWVSLLEKRCWPRWIQKPLSTLTILIQQCPAVTQFLVNAPTTHSMHQTSVNSSC